MNKEYNISFFDFLMYEHWTKSKVYQAISDNPESYKNNTIPLFLIACIPNNSFNIIEFLMDETFDKAVKKDA